MSPGDDHALPPMLFALPGNECMTKRLAVAIAGEVGEVAIRHFPDGETYLRVDSTVALRDVAVVASLAHPDEKLASLVFLADALRAEGARRIGLVAPYLPYMRQDTQFHPGEAVTSRSFASLVSREFDWLVTVDPHLHRIHTLRAIYAIPSVAVRASQAMGEWISSHVEKPLIVGPDVESRQWVEAVGEAAHAPVIVLTKERLGDTDVVESVPELAPFAGYTPVVVDDIISSGHTMAETVRRLREQQSPPPVCVAVHALSGRCAVGGLEDAGAARVVTTNTIAHATNEIDLVPCIADALREQFGLVLAPH